MQFYVRHVQESDEILFGSFARIEHVMTRVWLHGDPSM